MPGSRGPPARPGFRNRCPLTRQGDRRDVRRRPPDGRWRAKRSEVLARERDRHGQYREQEQRKAGARAAGAAQEADEGILAGQLAAASWQAIVQRRSLPGFVGAAPYRFPSEDATCGARLNMSSGPSAFRSSRCAVRAPRFGALDHIGVLAVRFDLHRRWSEDPELPDWLFPRLLCDSARPPFA